MNDKQIAAAKEAVEASITGRLKFPEIVSKLIDAGIERYGVDFARGEHVYYATDDSCIAVTTRPAASARDFSAAAVEAAIRASQAGAIDYTAFCARVIEAGCVSYSVWFAGRRATYFGRTGECHVEPFPQAH